MKFIFYKIYVKIIRKIIIHSVLKSILIKYLSNLYSISESIYVRYKDSESNLLDILADKGKCSLDIGALWGGYSVILKDFSNNLIVFEPNNNNYEFLVRSFAKYSKVKIINAAVSDSSDKATLKIPRENPGNATIEHENKFSDLVEYKSLVVETVKIDDLNLKDIGFIKIDIEGHEFSALKGMEEMLKIQKPNLLIEIEERHNAGSIERVGSFMKSLGYDIYFIVDNIIHQFGDFDLEKYQDPTNRNTRGYINNFIFIPINKSEKILNLISKRGINFIPK